MAEMTLAACDPFEGLTLPEIAGVVLTPSRIRHRLVFQAEAAALEGVARIAGFTALPAILRAATAGGTSLLRPGPDEWWLLGEERGSQEAGQMAGPGAIDITQAYAGFILKGPRAALALSAGCPLDLDIRAFPVGMVTRTLYGKSDILLWRQEEERFHIEIVRSCLAAILGFFAQTARGLPRS